MDGEERTTGTARATGSETNRPGQVEGAEQIPYDPNKEVSLSTVTRAGEEWGNVESEAQLKTCQETLRQMAENLLVHRQSSSTTIVDSAGIQETAHSNVRVSGEKESVVEGPGVPPADAVSPPLAEDAEPTEDIGLPTGLEERVTEQVRSVFGELRAMFQEEFDLKITVKETEEGRVIRFQSHPRQEEEEEGEPTSSEAAALVEVMPEAEVHVNVPRHRQTGQNAVSLVAEVEGQPVRLISVAEAGRPTAADGGSASTVNQAKIENELTAVLANQAAVLNVAIAIGNVINVQIVS